LFAAIAEHARRSCSVIGSTPSLHALLLLHGDPASGPIALSRLAIRTDDGCRHAPSVQRTAATMPWPGSARPDTFALIAALIAALVRQPGL
jgi:hypothetical protein